MAPNAIKAFSRGAVLMSCLAMAFAVLVFSQSFLFCFPPPKLAAAAMFGFLSLALAAGTGTLRRPAFFTPLAGITLWLIISWMRGSSSDRYASYLALPLASICIAWSVSSFAGIKSELPRITLAFVLTHLACGFYGVIQYFHIDPFNWALDYGPGRVFSSMGNPNFLAGQMVLALPVLAALGTSHGSILRWTARSAFLACFLALIFAQTRGAWLGLGAGSAFGGLVWFSLRRRLPSPRILAWPLVMAILCIGFFSFPSLNPTGLSVPSQFASSVNLDQQSARQRLFWWRSAAGLVTASPLIGGGTGNFIRDFPVFSSKYSAKWSDLGPAFADHPHNDILYLLCEYGIVGLGLILWLGVWLIAQGLRNVRQGSLINLGTISGITGLAVHSIWNMPSTIQGTMITAAFLLGLSFPAMHHPAPVGGSRPRVCLLLAGILLAGAFSFRPAVQLMAQWYYNDGRLLKEQKQNSMSAYMLRNTLALTSAPWRVHFMMGTVFYGAGYFGEARQAFLEDEHENPFGADAVLHQGKCLREMGDFIGAEKMARKALAILPNYPDATITLATMAYKEAERAAKAGRNTEKRSALRRAHMWLTFSLRFSPRHPEALKLLGFVEVMSENWQSAYDAWNKSLAVRPNDDALRYRMEALGNDLPRLKRGVSASPLRGGQSR